MKHAKGNHHDLKAVQEALTKRKQQLEDELNELQSGLSEDQTQDPADQASQAVFETLQSSLQNNELAEYHMIIKALDMIKKGTYGYCVDCEYPISERRLMSFPNASRCIVCQEKAEEA